MIKLFSWDFLEVKTNPEFKDSAQAYAAGFGEGLINKPIYAAWYNTCLLYTSRCV